jgi:hypothetical protein
MLHKHAESLQESTAQRLHVSATVEVTAVTSPCETADGSTTFNPEAQSPARPTESAPTFGALFLSLNDQLRPAAF